MNAANSDGACFKVVLSFFDALDRGEAPACAAHFAVDGTWLRQGNALTGREAIHAAVATRDAARRTTHIVSNLRLVNADASRARVEFLLTAYEGAIVGEAAPAARLAGIRRCRDDLVLTSEGWKIALKASDAWMSASGPTA